ncbi:MAG: multiheme c-type cytochrome [Cyclobacteriaceae bacterium]|nr:multiheme c-type cytochrome [Cyclobacteriaceae bacterium]
MVARNVPATFTIPTGATRYANNYVTTADKAYGDIGCSTCHSAIHNSYTSADLPSLTTVAPVGMIMWSSTKTIDLQADGGTSNLCVKCHQPRPLTKSADGNVLDYQALVDNPSAAFTQITALAYRSHVHYGSVGAIMAGMGGVEFAGAVAYGNSPHTANASCSDCHMAEGVNGRAGGHTFSAIGNYQGCNTTGCHADLSSSSSMVTNSKAAIKAKLDALAAKLVVGGVEILNRDPDSEHNLWYSATTNRYDGYLNVYDPNSNPDGPANNPSGQFKNGGNTSSWTQAQKDYNNTLPVLSVTNAQMGAIINFQMCLREFSLGMHNYKYSAALLDNSIALLP